MKILFLVRFVAIALATILLSSGCEKKIVGSNLELHENTKPLQAADLVGYDGTTLRKSVDKITGDNDKHNKEVENLTENQ